MKRRDFLKAAGCSAIALGLPSTLKARKRTTKPNIIYMMLDEWGYYEMSSLGHPKLKTPVFDEFRKEGMRFTQAHAGGPTCAPTRAVLMTGRHLGHVSVRGNGGARPICKDEITIAEILKDQGYATAGFGKWGIGGRRTTGIPEIHGFDLFFGYYDQVHAHTFYPTYLIRNSEEVPLKGNTGDWRKGQTHAQYVIFDETMKWLDKNHDKPSFLYLPYTPPHGPRALPDDDPYWQEFKDRPWRDSSKAERPKYPEIVAKIGAIGKREHTPLRRGGRLPNATVDAKRDRTVALGRDRNRATPKKKAPKKGKRAPGK